MNLSRRPVSISVICGLDEIPAEISDLVWVEHLTWANDWPGRGPENRFTDLAPLAHLTGLQTLLFAGTQVTDLAPLTHVIGLQWLNFSFSPVTELAPLARLTALQTLDFTKTPVAHLAPLAQLNGLRTIGFSKTQVTNLAPLMDVIRKGNPVKWGSDSWWEGAGIYVRIVR